MTQVVLDLDVVEEEVLKKLLDMGLFETPQEAFKIALLKYAMDLGGLKEPHGPIDVNSIIDLYKLGVTEEPEDSIGSKDETDEDPEDPKESG